MVDGHSRGTVIVVDDDADLRKALAVLMQTTGFATRTFGSGEALLEAGPVSGPACLLLDMKMSGISGLEVQEKIQQEDWDVPIIFLTGHAEVSMAVTALKRGAADFVEKPDFDPRTLIEKVKETIGEHEHRLHIEKGNQVLKQQLEQLSRREFEVARLVARGLTNKAIGLELGISEKTVEIHRGRAMKKLGLRSAADLGRLAGHFSGT